MSTFYVGQRVRLRYVREPFWKHIEGTEGSVIATGGFPPGLTNNWYGDVKVRMDLAPGRVGHFLNDQLEPLIPPGLEPLDEINALYEREPCTADIGSRGFHVPDLVESRNSDRAAKQSYDIAIRGRRL